MNLQEQFARLVDNDHSCPKIEPEQNGCRNSCFLTLISSYLEQFTCFYSRL